MKIWSMAIIIPMMAVMNAQAQYNGESQLQDIHTDNTVFTIAKNTWDVQHRGNHRAIVQVKQTGIKAVKVILPWRRTDEHPENKQVIITELATGQVVKNIYPALMSREKGILVFEPSALPAKYAIYYLPFNYRNNWDDARYGPPWNDYLPADYKTDSSWLQAVKQGIDQLPQAGVEKFEARLSHDFFTSMGLIATQTETQLLKKKSVNDFTVFPEDRAFPIRLTDDLPLRWIQQPRKAAFSGQAMRQEYYCYQLGIWAHKKALEEVSVVFSKLTHQQGKDSIARDSITCFNQEGTNWNGETVRYKVAVPADHVQALWCGIAIPANAKPGRYEGWATVTAANARPQQIKITIQVKEQVLPDRGDGELWRHARLRWLNSTLGMSNEVIAPFAPLVKQNNVIQVAGKQLTLNSYGLPEQVQVNGRQLLKTPMQFTISTGTASLALTPGKTVFTSAADGCIKWENNWQDPTLEILCRGQVEFDGFVKYALTIRPKGNPVTLSNTQLELHFPAQLVPYMMGAGLAGGKRPAAYSWDWKGPWDSFWIGDVLGGLHLEMRGGTYHGPLLNDYKPAPPPAWYNNGKGGITLQEEGSGQVKMTIFTGERTLQQDAPLEMPFAMLITPAKEVHPKKHFSERYYHQDPAKVEQAAQYGANIINIHHNAVQNPYINYPFIERDTLISYVKAQHKAGRKVKLYYTIRELTNYTTEIYALKSLGHEIFPDGPGQGAPWLSEHLVNDYKGAWYTPVGNQSADASIVLNGFSRWINYYIEGLNWMMKNYGIDGLYLDDVAYDREVLKRMRRVMMANNPGALLDLHSNTNYSIGPANQYADFFPYLDRVWFGEWFRYNKMTPDEWLVQFSGIPFGVMSEMLQDGGNRWLGMVYGATTRFYNSDETAPGPIWKYWDAVDIGNKTMYGYWNEDCPVKCDNENVKVTAYAGKDTLLLAIGNFSDTLQQARLSLTGEWKSWEGQLQMEAPAIERYQEARTFTAGQPITVPPKKGWLVLLTRKESSR